MNKADKVKINKILKEEAENLGGIQWEVASDSDPVIQKIRKEFNRPLRRRRPKKRAKKRSFFESISHWLMS